MHYFVVIIEYKTDIENIIRVTDEHRLFLQKGYEQGFLLISGPQVPRTGGVVLAKCNDKKELEDFFAEDPYFILGYAEYRYIEFNPKSYQPDIKDWVKE
jgi:uncharacterized protein YciI